MKKVILTPNPYRDKNFSVVLKAQEVLNSVGIETKICLPFDVDKDFDLPRNVVFSELRKEISTAQLLICFGGDGTLLHSSKAATYAGIPVLGVNIGTLGFMAELESTELELLRLLADDRYTIERRMMLDCKVYRDKQLLANEICLNDTVITKGAVARVVHLGVYCDEVKALELSGDGVIIATPTGSTGYNLSAGGPIVEPGAQNLLITPICAHAMQNRTIVAGANRVITVEVGKIGRKNAFVSVDGGRAIRLNTGDKVKISRSKYETKLIRLKNRSFFDIVSNKF